MKKKPLTLSEQNSQDSLKAKFDSDPEKKLFRLSIISRDQIRLAINGGSESGFTEYEFVYNDEYRYAWSVGARQGPTGPFDLEAVMFGGSTENLDTRKQDALLMAVTMALGMNECMHCDWPVLLELAKRTPDRVAYGE